MAPGGTVKNQDYWGLVRRLQRHVADELAAERRDREQTGKRALAGDDERQRGHALVQRAVRTWVEGRASKGQRPITATQEDGLVSDVLASMFGSGRLQQLLDDDELEGIEINGCDHVFVRFPDGHREAVDPVAESDQELVENVRSLAARQGLNPRPWDSANWQLDLRLTGGHRLSAVMGATGRPVVNIRRHRLVKVRLSDMVGLGTVTPELSGFLTALVRAKKNIVVAGETGAGKTTLLRALINEIDGEERLVTIENALELGIGGLHELHPNVVEFEARLPNSEGVGAITMNELVRRTLRMDPDRVIVGEVLGAEIVPMLLAMSQGNDGSLSTIHARDARGALKRMVSYARQRPEEQDPEVTRDQIAGAIDFVVFLRRDTVVGRALARRYVASVVEVGGYDPAVGVLTSEVWRPGPDGVAVRDQDVALACPDDLRAVGYDDSGWP